MTFQLSDDGAEVYERVLVPLWFARWADALLDLATLAPGQSVLDVACGTGVTTRPARAAVGPGGAVIGLDINAGMLAKAAELAEGQDIRWIAGDVAALDMPTDSIDVVLSQHGYHYFPDKPAALAEFRRVLRPGGRLLMSIWRGHSAYTDALCAAVARHISPEVAAKQSAQRDTPSAEALARQLTQAGYRDVRIVPQTLTIRVPEAETFVPLHLASMPIAAAFAALPETARTALISEVAEALAGHVDGGELVYEDAVNVMVGTC